MYRLICIQNLKTKDILTETKTIMMETLKLLREPSPGQTELTMPVSSMQVTQEIRFSEDRSFSFLPKKYWHVQLLLFFLLFAFGMLHFDSADLFLFEANYLDYISNLNGSFFIEDFNNI